MSPKSDIRELCKGGTFCTPIVRHWAQWPWPEDSRAMRRGWVPDTHGGRGSGVEAGLGGLCPDTSDGGPDGVDLNHCFLPCEVGSTTFY